jgi:arylsulfatase A-like enzyme
MAAAALSLSALASGQPAEAPPHEAAPPNVLLIISDDLSTALSGYGHPQCQTPNLDRLAARGVTFTRAYCQYPVCGPSRASILTGHYPSAIGETSGVYKAAPSDAVPPAGGFREQFPDLVTMPQFFASHGYATARVSKMFHMGIPGEIITGSSRYEDPASWQTSINIKAPEHRAPGELEDLSPLVTHQGMDFITVKADGGLEVHADAWAARETIRLMGELPQPFFIGVGMVRPHVPLVAPREYFDLYPWEDMILPSVAADDLDDVPQAAQTQTNSVKYGMSEEQQRKALAGYYASITFMDAQVGKLLHEVDRLGIADSTIIVFISDHGYNLGEHTSWQKLSLWEDTTRVPFLLAGPGVTVGSSGEIVELIDLFPTLADLAGLPVPSDLPGESLRPIAENPSIARSQNPIAYTITREGGESIRTDKWRYTVWNDGTEGVELYDHQNDPGEVINLAALEGHEEALAEVKNLLAQTRHRARPLHE